MNEKLESHKEFAPSSLFSPRALIFAAILGGCAFMVMWARLQIPILPDQSVRGDLRELFLVIASALSGPVGAVVAGFLATAYPSVPSLPLQIASMLAHIAAAVSSGLLYKKFVYPRNANVFVFTMRWILLVGVYYLILVSLVTLFIELLAPQFFDLFGNISRWQVYFEFTSAALPEALVTLFFTTVIMLALPGRYRRPLW